MYFPAGLEATAPFSQGEIRGGGPQAASGDSSSGNWSVRDGRSRADREADRNRDEKPWPCRQIFPVFRKIVGSMSRRW